METVTAYSNSRQLLSFELTSGSDSPASIAIEFAFPPTSDASNLVWNTGAWVEEEDVWYAQKIIGPAGDGIVAGTGADDTVELSTGWYFVYLRYTAAPEKPVVCLAQLQIIDP